MLLADGFAAILIRAGVHTCAFPLGAIVETMRPLPTEPLPAMPRFVRGIATIRGNPVPVVDLATLLGIAADGKCARYLVLGIDGRRMALSVKAVLGIRYLERSQLHELPPLLEGAQSDFVAAIGTHDQGLFSVLKAARLLPDDIWQQMEVSKATQ